MRSLLLLTALALVGCAHGPSDTAPDCSGQKRPANPHGSVLAGPAVASAPTLPAGSVVSAACQAGGAA